MTYKRIFALHDIFILFYLFPLRILASVLPVKMVSFLGNLLGYIYSSLSMNRKRSIQEKLTIALKGTRTKEEVKKLSHQWLRNAVSTYIDALVLNRISKHALFKSGRVNGLENLKSALSAQKGVILVRGHFCSNQVADRFLREMGFPLFGVGKKHSFDLQKSVFENKYLKPCWSKVFKQVREDEHVFIEDGDLGLKILKRLRENGLVIINLDARFSLHLIECSFLGTKRLFPADFLRIAYLTGAAIVPILCIGNSCSFDIFFEKRVELQKTSNKDDFISVNLNMLVNILESQILQYPDQWLFI